MMAFIMKRNVIIDNDILQLRSGLPLCFIYFLNRKKKIFTFVFFCVSFLITFVRFKSTDCNGPVVMDA